MLVYFGEPIHEFEVGGLEEIYRSHFNHEEAIIDALGGTGWAVKYLETFYDEDRLPAYKLMALRFEAKPGVGARFRRLSLLGARAILARIPQGRFHWYQYPQHRIG